MPGALPWLRKHVSEAHAHRFGNMPAGCWHDFFELRVLLLQTSNFACCNTSKKFAFRGWVKRRSWADRPKLSPSRTFAPAYPRHLAHRTRPRQFWDLDPRFSDWFSFPTHPWPLRTHRALETASDSCFILKICFSYGNMQLWCTLMVLVRIQAVFRFSLCIKQECILALLVKKDKVFPSPLKTFYRNFLCSRISW